MVTIRNIKTILTAPRGIDLVVVKVETSEPGLYGLGCATFTQRYEAVATAVNEYLKPLLEGRNVEDIEDIWQTAMGSSYWRNGPVLNNALSGVDEALWDIKGKMANMPVYDLFGGKCRQAAAVYRHTDGATPEEVEENVRRYMEQGYRYLRCQMGVYGGQMGKGKQRRAGTAARFFTAGEGPGTAAGRNRGTRCTCISQPRTKKTAVSSGEAGQVMKHSRQ